MQYRKYIYVPGVGIFFQGQPIPHLEPDTEGDEWGVTYSATHLNTPVPDPFQVPAARVQTLYVQPMPINYADRHPLDNGQNHPHFYNPTGRYPRRGVGVLNANTMGGSGYAAEEPIIQTPGPAIENANVIANTPLGSAATFLQQLVRGSAMPSLNTVGGDDLGV